MKYLIVITLVLAVTFQTFSQEKTTTPGTLVTTLYFIRHAEKDRSDPFEKNPHLIQKGLERANNWSRILGAVKFDAIYSTDYHRTKETAQPLAGKNALVIKIYDPNALNNIDGFLKENKGKTILIVGHSNTTPEFVNAMIGHKKYQDIEDNNNGNLYIVTIIGSDVVDQMLTIN